MTGISYATKVKTRKFRAERDANPNAYCVERYYSWWTRVWSDLSKKGGTAALAGARELLSLRLARQFATTKRHCVITKKQTRESPYFWKGMPQYEICNGIYGRCWSHR